jgi:hypothetical protein
LPAQRASSGRDSAEHDTGSGPTEWRRHLRGEPDFEIDPSRANAVERRLERDRSPADARAAYEQRKRELATAWQMPQSTRSWEREPVDPVAAVTVPRVAARE